MDTVFTKSAAETQALGRSFAKKLKGGEVICLYGELGAGKTVLVKGLAEGLGFKGRVLSPTFVFIRPYPCQGGLTLYHVDLYRMEASGEVEGLGLEDFLSKSNSIVVIEWAERLGGNLPPKRIDIIIENQGENDRKITFRSQD